MGIWARSEPSAKRVAGGPHGTATGRCRRAWLAGSEGVEVEGVLLRRPLPTPDEWLSAGGTLR